MTLITLMTLITVIDHRRHFLKVNHRLEAIRQNVKKISVVQVLLTKTLSS